jgi:predicted amidohydrolase YtcJ
MKIPKSLISIVFIFSCLVVQTAYAKSIILHNATFYTMNDNMETAEAVFIQGSKIKAVGETQTLLAMRKPGTLIIDLEGRVVFPGFIDPHTHLFNGAQPYFDYNTLDRVQSDAVKNGITSFANMYTDQGWLDFILAYAYNGCVRNRVFLYLNYNHSCGNVFGSWYEAYAPQEEYAHNVWINGIKIYAEQSVCNGVSSRPVFSDEMKENLTYDSVYNDSRLHLSLGELTDVIQRADDLGYQVAIHAMGDLGIETSLSAIAEALQGKSNINRHMILHNSFLRDEMLDLYVDNDILALIEPPSRCELNTYLRRGLGDQNLVYYKRWQDLSLTGIHMAMNSDWPSYGEQTLNPMLRLYAMVTGSNIFTVFSGECNDPIENQRLDVLQCLKMMTIEAAYVLHAEKKIGSIEPGKFADLAVLSHDPLVVDPEEIKNIKVLMTIINGKFEYWDEFWR